MRWSEGRGAGHGWEGQSGEELLPWDSSWHRRAESGPGRIQMMLLLRCKFFTFLGSGVVEVGGGRKGVLNKRPQLLTVRLVFRPPPRTRSKEARAGGVTGEG